MLVSVLSTIIFPNQPRILQYCWCRTNIHDNLLVKSLLRIYVFSQISSFFSVLYGCTLLYCALVWSVLALIVNLYKNNQNAICPVPFLVSRCFLYIFIFSGFNDNAKYSCIN